MKSILMLLAACVMVAAFSAAAFAQQQGQQQPIQQQPASDTTSRVVHQGNLDILVVQNPTSDLNLNGYRAFQQFADQYPQIAGALGNKPTLINDQSYLDKHPELARFMEEHPDVKAGFSADPGNYVAGAQARAESAE